MRQRARRGVVPSVIPALLPARPREDDCWGRGSPAPDPMGRRRCVAGAYAAAAAPAGEPGRKFTAGAVAGIFGGADVASSLQAAAQQADALIASYHARN